MDEMDPKDLTAEESAVARLRAADPASGATPDTTALRAVVDERRTAEPVDAPVVPDELAARRARRWTSWPAKVAGIAAAALIVGGGGGYAIGAAGEDDGGTSTVAGDGAAPAMSLQNPGAEDSGMESAADPVPDIGAPDTDVSRGGDAYWGGWGRTVFTASGLSDAGTVLHAWALDGASAFTEQTVAAAAAALGVAGTPQLVDGSWTVGPNDGTGPTLQMYPDGTASINYWDPTKDVWNCVTTTDGEATTDGGGTKGETAAEPDPGVDIAVPEPEPCEQRDFGPAPQGDAAAQVLRDVMTSLGLDPATFEFVTEDYGDESQQYAYVTAYQVLNDQRTGLTWNVSLTGAGITSLYGSTAPLVDIGEYQVISPVEAVARLGDPRFGSGSYGPLYYMAGSAIDTGVATDEPQASTPTVPPTVGIGSRISWPVSQATIVEARLGLALNTQADGAALLVPTYELVSDAGAVWSVIAVADAQLDFSAAR